MSIKNRILEFQEGHRVWLGTTPLVVRNVYDDGYVSFYRPKGGMARHDDGQTVMSRCCMLRRRYEKVPGELDRGDYD
jgi:hypothetical protein